MIAPSILAADFGRLREQVAEVVDAGAQVIHVDVMDGHFVPPLSMGPQAVSALRDFDVTLDVHLMVERPERHVEAFASAGADVITVHAEATSHLDLAVGLIREAGCRAGVAVCPATPPAVYAEVDCDLALCMTVNPGWGGQKFIDRQLEKIPRINALLRPGAELEVDGGIDVRTIGPAAAAGATWFVAGSSVFGAPEPGEAFRALADALGRP